MWELMFRRALAACPSPPPRGLCLRQVYFPVFVEGANLSMGDMHFSQGDGEVSFCGAIEMSGFLEIK